MERNKRTFYYCLFDGAIPQTDESGYDTGEPIPIYKPAVEIRAVVSPAGGTAQIEVFGTDIAYDKVIMSDDLTCPIDENTVLFLDKQPEYDDDGLPLYDYIVKRVAKSLNFVSYAVSRVDVS